MKGDVASDIACPIALACGSCRAALRSADQAALHEAANAGHAVGPCGAVMHPRYLNVHADNGGSWGTRNAETPRTIVRHALRQHFYQKHPGLSSREASLILDAADSGDGQMEAGPSRSPLEIGSAAADPPDRRTGRPLLEARAPVVVETPVLRTPIKIAARAK